MSLLSPPCEDGHLLFQLVVERVMFYPKKCVHKFASI
jgi:hypothetical protein